MWISHTLGSPWGLGAEEALCNARTKVHDLILESTAQGLQLIKPGLNSLHSRSEIVPDPTNRLVSSLNTPVNVRSETEECRMRLCRVLPLVRNTLL